MTDKPFGSANADLCVDDPTKYVDPKLMAWFDSLVKDWRRD